MYTDLVAEANKDKCIYSKRLHEIDCTILNCTIFMLTLIRTSTCLIVENIKLKRRP
jgi:hypothetical protein